MKIKYILRSQHRIKHDDCIVYLYDYNVNERLQRYGQNINNSMKFDTKEDAIGMIEKINKLGGKRIFIIEEIYILG